MLKNVLNHFKCIL